MWGKISQYHQDIEKWDLSPCVPRAGADCIPNTHHCSAGRYWWQTVSKDVQEFRLLTPFSVTVPYWTHWWMHLQFSFAISTFPFRKSAENSVYIYWKKTNKQKIARNFFFSFIFNRCILARQKRRRVTMPVWNNNFCSVQLAVTRTYRASTALALHVTEMKINPDRAEKQEKKSGPCCLPPGFPAWIWVNTVAIAGTKKIWSWVLFLMFWDP